MSGAASGRGRVAAQTGSAPAATADAPPEHRPSRVVVEPVRPVVDGGRFEARAAQHEPLVVEADVFVDGHDRVAAALRFREGDGGWRQLPMEPLGNDRWRAWFIPTGLGHWEYDVHGWVDHLASWRHGLLAKAADGQDVSVDLEIGLALLSALLHGDPPDGVGVHDADRTVIDEAVRALSVGNLDPLGDPRYDEAVWRLQPRWPVASLERPLPVRVDRDRAQFSAWYEFFPRSTVRSPGDDQDGTAGQGTLAGAIDRLDHIAALGFDVVYLPPVHPIGTTARKGPDNTAVAGPDDPGSPWAIGSEAGGHTAVDPALGTVDDVVALGRACRDRGMELALDIAFQCSPDHPWVTQHPGWFRHRPDGSIQYAENPPKRYQDIYPLDFESEEWADLWLGLRDVLRFWIDQGIRIFRVDNPHTKAFAFWEWVIGSLLRDHPDLIFLAEAFTRPRVMQRLAKLGFTQSYTYFAWRQSAGELRAYFEELADETHDYLRPNVWPNTPDILTEQLQTGGRPAFVARAILAATLAPNWGVYGPAFELGEHEPVRPGSEEYRHSEKYEVRTWDLDRPGSLAPLLSRLNLIRRSEPALRQLGTLRFHPSDDPGLLVFSKTDPAGRGRPVLVVVNVDPWSPHQSMVHVDWSALGPVCGDGYRLDDQLGGATYHWSPGSNYVSLTPWGLSAHVFTVSPAGGTGEAAMGGAATGEEASHG